MREPSRAWPPTSKLCCKVPLQIPRCGLTNSANGWLAPRNKNAAVSTRNFNKRAWRSFARFVANENLLEGNRRERRNRHRMDRPRRHQPTSTIPAPKDPGCVLVRRFHLWILAGLGLAFHNEFRRHLVHGFGRCLRSGWMEAAAQYLLEPNVPVAYGNREAPVQTIPVLGIYGRPPSEFCDLPAGASGFRIDVS